jgi:exodeoxyribonuclease X
MSNPVIALAIDTETTSNMPKTAGVCQLGAVALVIQNDGQDFETQTVMSTYCRPSEKILQEAINIHGITEDMVQWAPDEYIALQTLVAEILYLEKQGYDVVVGGHNFKRFDAPIMNRILGDESPFPGMYQFDTLVMGRRWFPDGEHKLGPFYTWFCGKEVTNAHDAAADCWMVCELLQEMMRRKETSIIEVCEWCDTPQLLEWMPWGKHKGMSFDEVPLSYMHWCRNNFKEPDQDLEYTLNYVIKQREAKQGGRNGCDQETKAG